MSDDQNDDRNDHALLPTSESESLARMLLWAGLVALGTVVLGGLVWGVAPRPLEGLWLLAVVVWGTAGGASLVLWGWVALQLKKRTGSFWPR